MNATTVDDRPAVTFDYEADDYATVLLENPEGDVVTEGRLEADENTAALYMGEPIAGEYKVILRQGGETATTGSAEFGAAEAELSNVTPTWEGTELVSVSGEIENNGELPLVLNGGEYSAAGETVTRSGYYATAVAGGESMQIDVEGSSISTILIDEPGEVEGELAINTSDGIATQSFTRTIEPTEYVIEDMQAEWDGNTLVGVNATVTNTGDLEEYRPVSVDLNEETLEETEITVPAGETDDVVLIDAGRYTEEGFSIASGGEYTTTVTIGNEDGDATASESVSFEDLDGEISDIEARFYTAGYDTEDVQLSAADLNIRNTGEVPIIYDTVQVSIDGETLSEEQINVQAVQPGSSSDVTQSFLDSVVVSPGSYEMTVELLYEGDVVLSETGTVSAE